MPRKRNHYEIIIGNVGRIHEGHNKWAAQAAYREACALVNSSHGRAAGEIVDFYTNGEIELTFDPSEPKAPKPAKPKKIVLPEQLWTIAFHTHNALGSISHVSTGEKFYTDAVKCQTAIDTMPPWPGMGDRSQYRPLPLTKGE